MTARIIKLKRPRRTLRYTTFTSSTYGAAVTERIRKAAARIDRLDRAVLAGEPLNPQPNNIAK